MKTNRLDITRLNMQTLLGKQVLPFYLFLFFLFFNTTNATAQINPGNRNQIADTTKKRDSISIIEAKLVELALAGPMYEGSKHQNRMNELQLKKVKNSWLNLLTLSGNYNDQTFKSQTGPTTVVYPKFFYGISIPLGIIFSSGTEVKSAKEAVAYSKNSQEQLARNLKADILTKYRQYRAYTEMINLAKAMIYDVKVNKEQAVERFGKNQITIESYNTALKNYSEEQNKLISLMMQQDLIKIDIEKSIGISLEEAIREAFQQ
jgi:outer membrane protein TolC